MNALRRSIVDVLRLLTYRKTCLFPDSIQVFFNPEQNIYNQGSSPDFMKFLNQLSLFQFISLIYVKNIITV